MMILQNKTVRQLVWHLQYVDTAVEGSEFYSYNTEGDRTVEVSGTESTKSFKDNWVTT